MCGTGQEASFLSSDHLHLGAASGKTIPSMLVLSFEISAMTLAHWGDGKKSRKCLETEEKQT